MWDLVIHFVRFSKVSTEGVERWVGGVYLLLRVFVTRVPQDLVLERLDHLGLSMEYIKPDGDVVQPSLHQSLSPKRFGTKRSSPVEGSDVPFVDPLNVTKPSIEPQIAIAR